MRTAGPARRVLLRCAEARVQTAVRRRPSARLVKRLVRDLQQHVLTRCAHVRPVASATFRSPALLRGASYPGRRTPRSRFYAWQKSDVHSVRSRLLRNLWPADYGQRCGSTRFDAHALRGIVKRHIVSLEPRLPLVAFLHRQAVHFTSARAIASPTDSPGFTPGTPCRVAQKMGTLNPVRKLPAPPLAAFGNCLFAGPTRVGRSSHRTRWPADAGWNDAREHRGRSATTRIEPHSYGAALATFQTMRPFFWSGWAKRPPVPAKSNPPALVVPGVHSRRVQMIGKRRCGSQILRRAVHVGLRTVDRC